MKFSDFFKITVTPKSPHANRVNKARRVEQSSNSGFTVKFGIFKFFARSKSTPFYPKEAHNGILAYDPDNDPYHSNKNIFPHDTEFLGSFSKKFFVGTEDERIQILEQGIIEGENKIERLKELIEHWRKTPSTDDEAIISQQVNFYNGRIHAYEEEITQAYLVLKEAKIS